MLLWCVCEFPFELLTYIYNLYLSGLEGLGFASQALGFGSVEGLGGTGLQLRV